VHYTSCSCATWPGLCFVRNSQLAVFGMLHAPAVYRACLASTLADDQISAACRGAGPPAVCCMQGRLHLGFITSLHQLKCAPYTAPPMFVLQLQTSWPTCSGSMQRRNPSGMPQPSWCVCVIEKARRKMIAFQGCAHTMLLKSVAHKIMTETAQHLRRTTIISLRSTRLVLQTRPLSRWPNGTEDHKKL
jgi:hypothetical protein